MQGLCSNIILGKIANPKEDGLQGIAVDERHPNDVLKAFVKVAIIFLITTRRQRDKLVHAIKGKAEQFSCVFSGSNQIPATVVFLEQIGMNHH